MRNRFAQNFSRTRTSLLAVTAIVALAGPIIIGIVNAAEPQAGTRGTATPGPVREYRISEISVTGIKSPQLNESIRSLLGMGVGDIYDESRLLQGL
jgi:hypothetical protein